LNGVMDVYPKPPGEHGSRFVEWHARLILDPVARLRYLRRVAHLAPPESLLTRRSHARRRVAVLVLALLVIPVPPNSDANAPAHLPQVRPGVPVVDSPDTLPNVWLVEKSEAVEVYSNGLRIDTLSVVANRLRCFRRFPRAGGGGSVWESSSAPAGIVFHTTESHLVDFEAERNGELKAASRGLLDYVRRNRSYHFVIDRFGRIHRVVQEADSANHAGWSVWADDDWIYINLNDSFLAVAFEARNRVEGGQPSVNKAQVHAGRVLTEMLRARYHIRPVNCVVHAQVSVNPNNRRIGYHTDWAANFPFHELGLPDNYEQPPPSLTLFGFGYDPGLGEPGEPGLWKGLSAAENQIGREAAARDLPVARYRQILQQKYREIIRALERESAWKEKSQ
jgi:hypothetical protein